MSYIHERCRWIVYDKTEKNCPSSNKEILKKRKLMDDVVVGLCRF